MTVGYVSVDSTAIGNQLTTIPILLATANTFISASLAGTSENARLTVELQMRMSNKDNSRIVPNISPDNHMS